jgi:hypothetical protein
MLQLRYVFLRGRFFRKVPGQHEFGFEHRAARLHTPIKCGSEPTDGRMTHMLLDIGDDLASIDFVPMPIEIFGREAELDDQVPR